MDDRNGLGPQGGYIAKITNDARETEMEENMGQVNTMIGNLRNMAIDMGSELENQNRQIDRINRKVSRRRAMASECAAPASKRCTAVVRRLGMALTKRKPPGRRSASSSCTRRRTYREPWSRERGVLERSLDSEQDLERLKLEASTFAAAPLLRILNPD